MPRPRAADRGDGGSYIATSRDTIVLLLALRFRRDADWRPYFRYTLATGLFCLAAVIFFLLFVGPPSAPPRVASELRGLVQRISMLPFFTWIALVTRRAYRDATATTEYRRWAPDAESRAGA